MKRGVGLLVVVIFAFMAFGCLNAGGFLSGDKTPTVEVSGPVKMVKKATLTIMGKDFKPGQELSIIVTDKNGIPSDIAYALKPEPKADASGAWSTKWECDDFIKRKLVKAGEYTLTVTDADYSPLASTSLSFVEEKK